MLKKIEKIIGYILVIFGWISIIAIVVTLFANLFSGLDFELLLGAILYLVFCAGLIITGMDMIHEKPSTISSESLKNPPVKTASPPIKKEKVYVPIEDLKELPFIFTINERYTEMPYHINGTFHLFAFLDDAEKYLERLDKRSCYIDSWNIQFKMPLSEFAPGYGWYLSSYQACGYKNVCLHLKEDTVLSMEELRQYLDYYKKEDFGVVHPDIIQRIHSFYHSDYFYYNHPELLTEDKKKEKDELFYDIVAMLSQSVLVTLAKNENDKKIIEFSSALMPNGDKWMSLFTDEFAVQKYVRCHPYTFAIPNLLCDVYKMIKDNPEFKGIMINPAREEFKINKNMLEKIVADQENPEFKQKYRKLLSEEKVDFFGAEESYRQKKQEEQIEDITDDPFKNGQI